MHRCDVYMGRRGIAATASVVMCAADRRIYWEASEGSAVCLIYCLLIYL